MTMLVLLEQTSVQWKCFRMKNKCHQPNSNLEESKPWLGAAASSGLEGEGGEYAIRKTTLEELDWPPPRVATRPTVNSRVAHSLLSHSLEVELKSR